MFVQDTRVGPCLAPKTQNIPVLVLFPFSCGHWVETLEFGGSGSGSVGSGCYVGRADGQLYIPGQFGGSRSAWDQSATREQAVY